MPAYEMELEEWKPYQKQLEEWTFDVKWEHKFAVSESGDVVPDQATAKNLYSNVTTLAKGVGEGAVLANVLKEVAVKKSDGAQFLTTSYERLLQVLLFIMLTVDHIKFPKVVHEHFDRFKIEPKTRLNHTKFLKKHISQAAFMAKQLSSNLMLFIDLVVAVQRQLDKLVIMYAIALSVLEQVDIATFTLIEKNKGDAKNAAVINALNKKDAENKKEIASLKAEREAAAEAFKEEEDELQKAREAAQKAREAERAAEAAIRAKRAARLAAKNGGEGSSSAGPSM